MGFSGWSKASSIPLSIVWAFIRDHPLPRSWRETAVYHFKKTKEFFTSFPLDIIYANVEEDLRLTLCQDDIGYEFQNPCLLMEALNVYDGYNMRLAQIGDHVQGLLLCDEARQYTCLTNGKTGLVQI